MPDYAFIGKMGAGKSTGADLLIEQVPNMERVPLALALKDVYKMLWPGEAFRRGPLQRMGQAWREEDEDVLFNYAKREMDRRRDLAATPPTHSISFVIDDMRYPNEWWKFKAEGFVTVKIVAPQPLRVDRLWKNGKLEDESQLYDATETALDLPEIIPDFAYLNDGSLEDFREFIHHVRYESEKNQ